MEIKVLGTGCARCRQLEKDVTAVLASLDVEAAVEKVQDIQKIMAYNVMSTPALVINEKVKVFGRVPSRSDLSRYIREELV
ncbi:MAG: thioredoxin family protein [Solirubrobacterales bacterium]